MTTNTTFLEQKTKQNYVRTMVNGATAPVLLDVVPIFHETKTKITILETRLPKKQSKYLDQAKPDRI